MDSDLKEIISESAQIAYRKKRSRVTHSHLNPQKRMGCYIGVPVTLLVIFMCIHIPKELVLHHVFTMTKAAL